MSDDIQQDSKSQPNKKKWWRYARFEWAIIAILLVLGCDMLMRSPAAHRRHYTCVICRLQRTEVEQIHGSTEITFHETPCSNWYPSNVEPSHEHVWSKGSSIAILNHYGQVTGVGDNFDQPGRAIRKLTPEEQIEVYNHFADPLEAKRIFVSLMDPDVMTQHGNRGDYLITTSLKAWVDSGFSSPWKNPLGNIETLEEAP